MRLIVFASLFVVLTGMEGGGCGGEPPKNLEPTKREGRDADTTTWWVAELDGETAVLELDFLPLVTSVMAAVIRTPSTEYTLSAPFVDGEARGDMVDESMGTSEPVRVRFTEEGLELAFDPEGDEQQVVTFRQCPDDTCT